MALERIVGRTGWDKARFAMSVVMDMIGSASYLGYLFGPGAVGTESSDVVFAPIQSMYLLLAYHRWDSILAAAVGGAEELAPGTDGIPTCTLYHIYVMRQKYGSEAVPRIEPARR
jgi:hypothetical protein